MSFLRAAGHQGRLVGLDRSEAMIAEASAPDAIVEWVIGDIEQLPYRIRWLIRRDNQRSADDPHSSIELISTCCVPSVGVSARQQASGELHENTAVLLGGVWPHVEEVIIDSAFVFTSAEPITRYVATLLPAFEDTDIVMQIEMIAWRER